MLFIPPNNISKLYKAIKDQLKDLSVDFKYPPAKLKYGKISKALDDGLYKSERGTKALLGLIRFNQLARMGVGLKRRVSFNAEVKANGVQPLQDVDGFDR